MSSGAKRTRKKKNEGRLTRRRESSSAGRAVMELLVSWRTESFRILKTHSGTAFIFREVKFKEVPWPYRTLATDFSIWERKLSVKNPCSGFHGDETLVGSSVTFSFEAAAASSGGSRV